MMMMMMMMMMITALSYTQGEMTSQKLWSRYVRHFVGITCRAYSKRVPALIVHSELKSVHPGFPVAFIFLSTS